MMVSPGMQQLFEDFQSRSVNVGAEGWSLDAGCQMLDWSAILAQ